MSYLDLAKRFRHLSNSRQIALILLRNSVRLESRLGTNMGDLK